MNVMVVDDEPLLRFHLQKLLQDLWDELEQVICVGSGVEAVERIRDVDVQTVFMDIKMPGMNGIETAGILREMGFSGHLVFVTAYDQHALEAFEHEAVDYLLKPVHGDRLYQCIERLRKRDEKTVKYELDAAQLKRLLPVAGSGELRWINATRGQQVHVIPLRDVCCFIAEDKYTTVVTENGEFLIRKTIKELTETLDSDQFWRIHRATIVQVGRISRVERDQDGYYQVIVDSIDRVLPVSRTNSHLFKQM